MKILAGTAKGVFAIENDNARCVLERGGVRDLVKYGERLFAGTGAGLYISDDGGDSWSLAGVEAYEVWVVRRAGPPKPHRPPPPPGTSCRRHRQRYTAQLRSPRTDARHI